ncbi:MAG: AraC family transcriptional regulator [Oscillospiraceae bacterium]|nr:AraC family transcriptional regulator [Oscillospiraceae bacterium]
MNIQTIQEFHKIIRVPMHYYENNKLSFEYMENKFHPNPISMMLPYIEKTPSTIGYIVTEEHLFYGFVRLDDMPGFYVMGPTSAFKPTLSLTKTILKNMKQSIAGDNALLWYLSRIPLYTESQSKSILSMLDYLVNGKIGRNVNRVHIFKTEIAKDPDLVIMPAVEHINNDLERTLISYVEHGRTDLMDLYFDKLIQGSGVPQVSLIEERAIKNIFIFSLGIVSRTAYRAGMPYDMMNETTDYFIMQIEEKSGYIEVIELMKRMFMSFANAVALIKKASINSLTAYKIHQLIHSRLHEKITPTIIADELQMSLSYLCRHYKAQTGKTITTYINEIKIDEAKRLLTATDMSVLEVSAQLGYASSNYMSMVFKKITGLTPNEHKNAHVKGIVKS